MVVAAGSKYCFVNVELKCSLYGKLLAQASSPARRELPAGLGQREIFTLLFYSLKREK